MQLIKSATTYRAHLPQSHHNLADLLAAKPFVELGPSDFSGAGFVPPTPGSAKLVIPFAAGYAFAVRYDEKIVPASIVKVETEKRIAEIEELDGVRLGKNERKGVREDVFHSLVMRALTKTTVVPCFFAKGDYLLIVPTTSKKLADTVTGQLVRVMGSLKATTIYVSEAKGNLTTRLADYLSGKVREFGDDGFGVFDVGSRCKLRSPAGLRFSFDLSEELNEATQGIQEALRAGSQVEEIELLVGDTSFRLTADFRIKGIDPGDTSADAGEFADAADLWRHEAAIQTATVACLVRELCILLDYKEPVYDEPAEALPGSESEHHDAPL